MRNRKITLRNKATDTEPKLQETPSFISISKVKVKNVGTNKIKLNGRGLDILKIHCIHVDNTVEEIAWIFEKDLTKHTIEFPEDSEFKLSIPEEWRNFDDLVVTMELESTSAILITKQ